MATEQTTIQVEIHILLQLPPEQLELRKRLRSADVLANLISGFAHAEGGTIVIGYDPQTKKAVGCRRQRIEGLLKEAESRLGHTTLARIGFHQVDGRELGVIQVPKIDRLIVAPGGLLVRQKAALRAMDMATIKEKLQLSKQRLGVEDMGNLMFQMSVIVNKTHKDAAIDRSWPERFKSQIFSAVVGLVVGTLLTPIFQYLMSLVAK